MNLPQSTAQRMTNSEELVILGAGGHAKEIAFLVEEINRAGGSYTLRGFLDPDVSRHGQLHGKYPILGGHEWLEQRSKRTAAAIGIGDLGIARRLYQKFQPLDHCFFPVLIHPNVVLDRKRVHLGPGCVAGPGCVFTTDIEVGAATLFNRGVHISHDCRIGNWCVINPMASLSGGLVIGDEVMIGTNATVLQYLSIGTGATVGAGAVVTNDVQENQTVGGVPAREIPRRSS